MAHPPTEVFCIYCAMNEGRKTGQAGAPPWPPMPHTCNTVW